MGYAYQATVVIPAAMGSTTLTNFSVAISFNNALFKTAANGGQIQNMVTRVGQTVPADLVLSSDVAATALYKWGWDSYSATAGTGIIWVLIPSYTTGAAITIYVSFGDATVSTYQGGTQGQEFDSNLHAVYHVPDGTTLSVLDFSSNSNNGTNVGLTAGAGIIDGGATSGSTTKRVTVPTGAFNIGLGNAFTWSAWVKYTQNSALNMILRLDTSLLALYLNITSGNKLQLNNTVVAATSAASLSGGIWYHIAAVVTTLNAVTLYINGSADGTATLGTSEGTYSNGSGFGDSFSNFLNGTGDELKLAWTARTSDWLLNEYTNQNSIPVVGTPLAQLVWGWAGQISEPLFSRKKVNFELQTFLGLQVPFESFDLSLPQFKAKMRETSLGFGGAGKQLSFDWMEPIDQPTKKKQIEVDLLEAATGGKVTPVIPPGDGGGDHLLLLGVQ